VAGADTLPIFAGDLASSGFFLHARKARPSVSSGIVSRINLVFMVMENKPKSYPQNIRVGKLRVCLSTKAKVRQATPGPTGARTALSVGSRDREDREEL
jgi:hypothetical protein